MAIFATFVPSVTQRYIVGCMTGTSIDAIDATLVRIDGAGLAMQAAPVRFASRQLADLAAPLRRLARQEPMPARDICRLSHELAALHIAVIRAVAADQELDLIALHGQTIFHDAPLSWQLASPAPIAHEFRVPVVFDLRAADLAAGGQGAPITPLADFILFRDARERRAVLNLGGFANCTLLPTAASAVDQTSHADEILRSMTCLISGGDLCSCNHLLDEIARQLLGQPLDQDGRHASAGAVQTSLLAEVTELLSQQARAGRSLGTADDLVASVRGWGKRFAANDVARTACESVARVTAARLAPIERILVAGGGAHNTALLGALRNAASPSLVVLTDDFGVPIQYREAVAMAVLGALCQDRVPITLPQITHVPPPAPVAGAWSLP